jgi:glycerate 2-kinase
MELVAAPDKFRGTLSGSTAAAAMANGARDLGWAARERPLADGGEGSLDVLGGPNRTSTVAGPLGSPVVAGWRLEGDRAVVEMAAASGLNLAGGPQANDPERATTYGTGELIAEAIQSGARRIIVAVGGSATTDGGLGAVDALSHRPFHNDGVAVVVACDVDTRFLDAAPVFAPQKGADPATVERLTKRLEEIAARYLEEFGVDVRTVDGGGAAGGLAGGLFALGASLRPGFELIAGEVGLDTVLGSADLVVTGEGEVDATSFAGKVVGGVQRHARRAHVPFVIVAGQIAPGTSLDDEAISLVERYGTRKAFDDTAACLRDAVRSVVATRNPGDGVR